MFNFSSIDSFLIGKKKPSHRVIDHFESLLDFDWPDFSLNLEKNKFRFYLLSFLIIQFLCCLILLILNNWHYLLKWFGKTNSNFKRTQSVNDFIQKTTYELNKLNYLEKAIEKQKKEEPSLGVESRLSQDNLQRQASLLSTRTNNNNTKDSDLEIKSSYLFVPYFKNSKSSCNLSDTH
jgi:hypothetical protein